jgi:hypothetical protein
MNINPGGVVDPGKVGAMASTPDGNGAVVYSLAKNTKECWWIADNPAAVTANTPWLTAITAGIPASGPGIPTSQGVFYGVFKGGACSAAGIAAATSNIATTGFPKAQ